MLESVEQVDARNFVLDFMEDQYPNMYEPPVDADISQRDAYENRCASRVGLLVLAQRIEENPFDDILGVIDIYLDEIAYCLMDPYIRPEEIYELEAQRCSVEHIQSYIRKLY